MFMKVQTEKFYEESIAADVSGKLYDLNRIVLRRANGSDSFLSYREAKFRNIDPTEQTSGQLGFISELFASRERELSGLDPLRANAGQAQGEQEDT